MPSFRRPPWPRLEAVGSRSPASSAGLRTDARARPTSGPARDCPRVGIDPVRCCNPRRGPRSRSRCEHALNIRMQPPWAGFTRPVDYTLVRCPPSGTVIPVRWMDGTSSIRLGPQGAQCPLPNDPRHGSRPSDAPLGLGSRVFGGRGVPTGTAADAKQKRRAALARRKKICAKRERCVPLSLVVLDRLMAIEADNNTDQVDAHTEDGLPR